jgi:hypothetical protein
MISRIAPRAPHMTSDGDVRCIARPMPSLGCVAIHGTTADDFGAGVSDDPARRVGPTG